MPCRRPNTGRVAGVLYRVARLPGRVVACLATRPGAKPRAISRPTRPLPPSAIQFVSRLSLAGTRSCHDTNDYIMTHLSGQAALLSRYKQLYRDPSPASQTLAPVTIQCFVSRHSPLRPSHAHELPQARRRCRTPGHAAGRVAGCIVAQSMVSCLLLAVSWPLLSIHV